MKLHGAAKILQLFSGAQLVKLFKIVLNTYKIKVLSTTAQLIEFIRIRVDRFLIVLCSKYKTEIAQIF